MEKELLEEHKMSAPKVKIIMDNLLPNVAEIQQAYLLTRIEEVLKRIDDGTKDLKQEAQCE